MAVPPTGWRVPYLIVYGEPGRPLIHSVRTPEEVLEAMNPTLLASSSSVRQNNVSLMRPNAQYYITKVIVPALDRCFTLIGADVMSW